MLQYFDVTRDAPWFPQVKALYESAFPANERIPIKHLLDNKIKREFWAFFDKKEGGNAAAPKFCGFSNSISHGDITNIVYFAVVSELRSRGYGSQILQAIRKQHPDTRALSSISKSKKIPRTPRNSNAGTAAANFTPTTALTLPPSITSGKASTTAYFPPAAPSPKRNSATSGKKSSRTSPERSTHKFLYRLIIS